MIPERNPLDFQPARGGWSFKGFKGKGGGSSSQPAETPDSLHSTAFARVLDLVSEGEIVGLANGLQSIFLNETPLQNADGSLNFTGVQVEFRSGTVFQSYIPGYPAAESSTEVNTELKFGTPWVRSFSNSSLSAVRLTLGVNGLSKADTSEGIKGYSVAYAIDLQTAGGAWVEVVNNAFTGKTTNSYRRTHRIDLPATSGGWNLRVRRLTAQANSQTVADTTIIDSFVEVIDGKLRHPMSALVGLTLDATQFSGVPTRGYHLKGRIIKVPSNYDPVTRVYTGVWNGTFKPAYSNNPAWVYYDMLANDVYGLGNLIPNAYIDKWSLYQIGAYCDEMVSDGRGGTEPRFTCNLYLQTAGDALKVLMDLASIFRGMMYWSAGSAIPVADMPRDDVFTYNQGNVLGGVFNYSGSRRKDRVSVALVSWNDMADMGRQKVVAIQDDDAVRRYGVRQVEVSAFGCTSEAQATRLAKWLLLTSLKETETVTFTVGLDGTLAAPGQVIKVADNLIAGRRIGGRISSAPSKTQIVVDSITQVQYGDELTVVLPSGKTQTRPVTRAMGIVLTADGTRHTMDTTKITADAIRELGSTTTIPVSPGFDEIPLATAPWSIDTKDLKTQLFNVVRVAENGGLSFELTCVQHEPGKFSAIDNGTRLEPRPVSVVPPMVQPAPASVTIGSYSIINQGISSATGVIEWPATASAVAYEVEWRRDNSDWVRAGRTQTTRIELPGIYAGIYVARVRALNSIDSPSLWTQSQPTTLTGIIGAPPSVTTLTTVSKVMAIDINWGFPAGANIVERTELWYSTTSNRAQAIKLADIAYPQNVHTMLGLASGVEFWFWARLVDKNGLPGPWYPTGAGVRGKSSTDPNAILGYLTGQIDETMLGPGMGEKINKIPTMEQNLAQETLDRIQQGQNLGTQISTETTLRTNADTALGSRIDTVRASTASNAAAITTEVTARTNADTALGQRIDTVVAANATNAAAIQTEVTARTNADTALGQRIDTVSAVTNQNKADIITETTARTSADTALAQSITTLSGTVNGNTAAIQTEATTRASADTALGTRIDTVTADVGTVSAAVQTNATAIADSNGKIAAMYSIKTQLTVDNVPYIAGIGVGAENNNGIVTTQILLSAQRIVAFNETNNSKVAPFAIANGQVIMNTAIIGNASIGSAKFADTTSSDAVVNGQPVFSINWRTGVQKSISLNGGIRSEQGTGYWFVTDTSTGVVVLEIDARG